MLVRDLMTSDVITVDRDSDLMTAEKLMAESRIRQVPVIDEDFNLVGLLTQRDLLRAELSHLHDMEEANQRLKATVQISRVMQAEVITARPDQPLREVADTLRQRKFGCMPVVDDQGKLVGIVSSTDFLRLSSVMLDLFSEDERLREAVSESAGHKPRT